MKTYIVITAIIFALLTVAHVWRGIEEGPQLAKQPWFILLTIAFAALGVWALRLLRRWPRS